eukprot:4347035-Lingulodinium_polyedra.AAC.1
MFHRPTGAKAMGGRFAQAPARLPCDRHRLHMLVLCFDTGAGIAQEVLAGVLNMPGRAEGQQLFPPRLKRGTQTIMGHANQPLPVTLRTTAEVGSIGLK